MEEPHVAWRKVGAEGHAIFNGGGTDVFVKLKTFGKVSPEAILEENKIICCEGRQH